MEATATGVEPPVTRPTARASLSEEGRGAAFAAELLGTFLLVLAITVIVSLHHADALRATDWAVIGLVHVFVLMLLIHSLGGASGAHFNPAVTISLLAIRKIRPPDAVIYVLVQCIGAILATLVTKLLLENEGDFVNYGALGISDAQPAPPATPGAPAPAPTGPDFLGGAALGGLAVEAIGTFILMWAIMATAVNPRGERHWAGFVIGASLGLGVMLFGPLTGAGFNPARWLGPAAVSGTWDDAWVFILGPIIGALVATFAFKALVLGPQERIAERPIDVLD